MINYTLAVLTHGNSNGCLHETVDSFQRLVTPQPDRWLILHDGGGDWQLPFGGAWEVIKIDPQVGFCRATRQLWHHASDPGTDFVFWLEHDFRFERVVNLEEFAAVLTADPKMAQMSLRRNQTPDELFRNRKHALGGLFGHRLELFDQHVDYATQHIYFTTNPSLMRSQFMREQSWIQDPEGCEGKMTIALRDDGFHFGIWGEISEDRPWVTHIGERTGFGY